MRETSGGHSLQMVDEPVFSGKNPLWLPKGSIRALITIGTLTLIGILALRQIQIPDWLVLWAGLIVKSYFDERRKNGAPE